MKKVVAAVVTVCAPVALVAVPSAAHAAGCVTRAEYSAVKKGMPESKVHAKFGTAGKRMSIATSSGYASEVRTYQACGSKYSTVAVSYSKDPGDVFRLAAKNAVWVG